MKKLIRLWTGGELHDPDNDHVMSSMIDVLQTVGVSVGDATAYATMVIKDRAPISAVQAGQQYDPTFFDLYGKGNLVRASHGCRRYLHVNGLDEFDLRTMKPNQSWKKQLLSHLLKWLILITIQLRTMSPNK